MTSFGVWLRRPINLVKGGIKQCLDRWVFFTPWLEKDRIIEGAQIVPAGLIDYHLNKGPHFVCQAVASMPYSSTFSSGVTHRQ